MVANTPSGKTVVLAGASGLIGTALIARLRAEGYDILQLVRREPKGPEQAKWNPDAGELDPQLLEGAAAVVNLAGASTAKLPWTPWHKQAIMNSRVQSTKTIVTAINATTVKPKVLLSGSASGIYGDRPGEILTERSELTTDGFLAEVALAWEQTAAKDLPNETRLVLLRTGLVLAWEGALKPFRMMLNLRLGTQIGNGKQYWPWISLTDQARAIEYLINSKVSGPVNLVSPNSSTAEQVLQSLAKQLGRRIWIRIPAWVAKIGGQAVKDLILIDQHIEPVKLVKDGFRFEQSSLDSAIASALVQPEND